MAEMVSLSIASKAYSRRLIRNGLFVAMSLGLAVAVRAQSEADGSALFVQGLTAAQIERLRSLGKPPALSRTASLLAALRDADENGQLSSAVRLAVSNSLQWTSAQPLTDAQFAQLIASAPRTLTDEQKMELTLLLPASVVESASANDHGWTFLPEDESLPPDLMAVDHVVVPDNPSSGGFPEGQVVDGTSASSNLGMTLQSMVNIPGLQGATWSVARVSACAEMIHDLNAKYDLWLQQALSETERLAFLDLLLQVGQECFDPPGSSVESRSFGMLELPDGGFACSALIVGPSLILTARHCLFNPTDGSPRVAHWSEVFFHPFGTSPNAVAVADVIEPATQPADKEKRFLPSFDAVLATLAAPLAEAAEVCWGAPAGTSPTSLAIFGPVTAHPDDRGTVVPWQERVRLSSGGQCATKIASAGCLIHYCNTLDGFSGSPVFGTVSDGCPGVRVAAMHLRSVTTADGCATNVGNVGMRAERILILFPQLQVADP